MDLLDEKMARALVEKDPEAAIFLLLEQAGELKRLREENEKLLRHDSKSPSAPSSSTPVFKKPNNKKKRSKRGAKNGHDSNNRPKPKEPDRTETHALNSCPHCATDLRNRAKKVSKRTIEDIIAAAKFEAVEHHIEHAYCPCCKKDVAAVVTSALPKARIGLRAMTLALWMRFQNGLSLSQIQQVFNSHLQTSVSQGALVESGYKLAEIFRPWYNQIGEQVKQSGVVNADETGWRVNGQTHWLWCFCSSVATYYQIDRARGSPALSNFFTEAIHGILITDFWRVYLQVESKAKQVCLPHLFRDLDATSIKNTSNQWLSFCKKLKRLLRDALRLKDNAELPEECCESRRQRLEGRLDALLDGVDTSRGSKVNHDVKRIVKRLRTHREAMLTFLYHLEVPSHNNRAEREIRPAVQMRKNSYGNQSNKGAEAQAILMSVFRTLKNRKLDLLATAQQAIETYLKTGKLPPLPTENQDNR